MWHDVGIGVGQRRGRLGGSPLSISAPASYIDLFTNYPLNIGATISFADTEDVGGTYVATLTAAAGTTLTATGWTGTGTNVITRTATLTVLNESIDLAAELVLGIAGAGSDSINVTLVRSADSVAASPRNISVDAYAALDFATLDPADNATGILYNAVYTITFDRPIQAGTGNVVYQLAGGAALETFNIATLTGDNGGTLAISGSDLILTLGSAPPVSATEYEITIAATCIDGAVLGTADSYAGLATTAWSFTQADTTPTLSSPLDSATGGTTATANVSTDIAHGTLYAVVYEGANPSHAQIVAGNDAGDVAAPYATNQSVSAVGSQSAISAAGLDSETAYKTAFTQISANGAPSTPVYADGFTTDDVTAPTVTTLSPADGAAAAPVNSTLVMTFDEGMARQGTVTLKNVGGATVETFDLSTDGTWSTVVETDDRWTGTPASDFVYEADLAVQWSGLEDTSGNTLANNTTDTTWNFTASAEVTTPTLLQGITVNADGWTVDVDITGDLAGTFAHGTPSSPNFAITLTSKSWTTAGVETTKSREVFIMSTSRKVSPNQADREETDNLDGTITTRFTLNDYVHAADTITAIDVAAAWFTDTGGASATNTAGDAIAILTDSSAHTYPEPVANWIIPDRQVNSSSTFTPKLAVFHKYFEFANQVRAVKFILTDESANSVEAFATSMTSEAFSVAGMTGSYYSADISTTGLDDGEVITVDAIIYPWIGDSYQLSVDGNTYPSQGITTMTFANDRAGGYNPIYAYVDATLGNNGTGVASATPATAQASPYQTIEAAMTGAIAENNSANSRNTISGCVIRLEEDTYTAFGGQTMSNKASSGICATIEAVGTVANTIVDLDGSSYGTPHHVIFKGITFNSNSANFTMYQQADNAGVSRYYTAFSGCDFTITAASWPLTVGTNIFDYFNCTTSAGDVSVFLVNDFSNYRLEARVIVGCDFTFASAKYFSVVFASRFWTDVGQGYNPKNSGGGAGSISGAFDNGNICAFSFMTSDDASMIYMESQTSNNGFAMAGNVFESIAGTSLVGVMYHAENNGSDASNIILIANTVVGNRHNMFYNDGTNSPSFENCTAKLELGYSFNIKGDVFADIAGAPNNDNWNIRYKVGWEYIACEFGDITGFTGFTPGSWLGDVSAPGEEVVIDPDFVNDKSANGDGLGGGDYQPGALNTLPTLPARLVPWPKDLTGNVYAEDGTDLIGAICVSA